MWWLTTVCRSSPGISDAPFWPPWVLRTSMVHRCTCRYNSHTQRTNFLKRNLKFEICFTKKKKTVAKLNDSNICTNTYVYFSMCDVCVVCVCMQMCTHGNKRRMWGVLLYHSPSCYFETGSPWMWR